MNTNASPDNPGSLVGGTQAFFGRVTRPIVKRYTNRYAFVSAFPWRVRNLANIITVTRLVLSFLAAYGLYLFPAYAVRIPLAIFLFLLAASDGIDGAIARGLRIQSRFGAAVDPVADFVMVGSLAYFLVRHLQAEGARPALIHELWWTLTIMIGMQILVFVVGILRENEMRAHGVKATSTKSGKIKFVAQCFVVAIGWMMAPTHLAALVSLDLLLFATVFTAISLLDYTHEYVQYRRR